MRKALLTHQEITPSEGRAEIVEFKASGGWPAKFMCSNNLSLGRKTSVAQEGPDKLIVSCRKCLLSFIIIIIIINLYLTLIT